MGSARSVADQVSWIHLSDFHFTAGTDHGRDEVLGALLDDLAGLREGPETGHADRPGLRAGPIHPDLLLITGDIAAGGKRDEYHRVALPFLQRVCEVTGVSRDRVFLIPGNHDVDRDEHEPLYMNALVDRATYLDYWRHVHKRRRMIGRNLAEYRAFAREVNPTLVVEEDQAGGFCRAVHINGRSIAILGLSSCWLGQGGAEDDRRLIVGREQVFDLAGGGTLDQLRSADLRIALVHHPVDWLREFDRQDLVQLLGAHVDVVLRGHLHSTGLDSTTSPDHELTTIAAGACFAGSHYRNAYNVVQVSFGETLRFKAWLRAFSTGARCFVQDVETYAQATNGTWEWTHRNAGYRHVSPSAGVRLETTGGPVDLPLAHLSHLERTFRRAATYTPLRPSLAPDIEDVFVVVNASQRRLVEEEDRVGNVLRQQFGTVQPTRRMVELPVVGSILDVVERHPCVLLTGRPGSGKTFFLKYLTLRMAKEALNEKRPPEETTGARIPIYISLRDFHASMEATQLAAARANSLEEYIQVCLEEHGCREDRERILARIRDGACILLLDGLDEVGTESGRRDICRIIRAFSRRHRNNLYVVASRELPARTVNHLGEAFFQSVVWGLDERSFGPFLERWTRAIESAAPRTDLWTLQVRLLADLRADAKLAELARNPLLLYLTLLLSVSSDRELGRPASRHDVYERCIDLFFDELESQAPRIVKMRDAIEHLASAMHRERTYVIDQQRLEMTLETYYTRELDYEKARAAEISGVLVDRLRTVPVLLVADERHRYAFLYPSFQEYLVARRIARSDDPFAAVKGRLPDEHWHEVVVMVAGCLSRGASPLLEGFIEKVMDTPAPAGNSRNATLAAECVTVSDQVHRSARCVPRVRRRLLEIVSDESVALAERIRCGNLLGRIGDSRDEVLQPEMISIPGRVFLVGSSEEEIDPLLELAKRDRVGEIAEQAWGIIRTLYRWETPVHQVSLQAYQIGRFQITNRQYKRFVDDTNHPDPFHEADWAEPYNWRHGTYPVGLANHPVVLISYEDAAAFCRWLRQKSGKAYRLPTEPEWEGAARGPMAWPYPWGVQSDFSRCNMLESGLKATVPIGTYPHGASPYGVMDMIGNVWEWCSTIWGERWDQPRFCYPYRPDDGREDEDAPPSMMRVVRGGSWSTDRSRARCAYRTIDVPGTRNRLSVGFRVALSVPDGVPSSRMERPSP